jgi:hypothetical protein
VEVEAGDNHGNGVLSDPQDRINEVLAEIVVETETETETETEVDSAPDKEERQWREESGGVRDLRTYRGDHRHQHLSRVILFHGSRRKASSKETFR